MSAVQREFTAQTVVELNEPQLAVAVQAIIGLASRIFGVRVEVLLSRDKKRPAVVARSAAMAVSKEVTQLSLPALGRIFGTREHTTVRNAIRMFEKYERASSDIARKASALRTAARQLDKGVLAAVADPQTPDAVFADLGFALLRACDVDAVRAAAIVAGVMAEIKTDEKRRGFRSVAMSRAG